MGGWGTGRWGDGGMGEQEITTSQSPKNEKFVPHPHENHYIRLSKAICIAVLISFRALILSPL